MGGTRLTGGCASLETICENFALPNMQFGQEINPESELSVLVRALRHVKVMQL